MIERGMRSNDSCFINLDVLARPVKLVFATKYHEEINHAPILRISGNSAQPLYYSHSRAYSAEDCMFVVEVGCRS